MTTKLSRPQNPNPVLSAEEHELGMDCDITRRDFANAVPCVWELRFWAASHLAWARPLKQMRRRHGLCLGILGEVTV